MNTKIKISLLAIAAVSASQAYAGQDAGLPVELPEYTVQGIAVLPTPTHNPIPVVSASLVGTELKLYFTVNAKGRPEHVRLSKPLFLYFSDLDGMSFAGRMRDLVANWKFEPARNTAGDPVAVKVLMPVNVIKKGSEITALASLILDTGDEDAS